MTIDPKNPAPTQDVDEEFIIEVVDDETPNPATGAQADPKNQADPNPDLTVEDDDLEPGDAEYKGRAQKRIRELVRKRKELEARAVEAERRLQEREAELETSRSRSVSLEESTVTQMESAVEARLAKAQADYKRALQDDNPDAIIEAQTALSEAHVQKAAIKAHKASLEQRKGAPPARKPDPKAPDAAPQPKPDARASKWVKDNPWFNTDPALRGAALGVHQSLVMEGYNPGDQDDDEMGQEAYYRELDNRLRTTFPDKFKESNPNPGRRQTVAGAPRSSAPNKSNGKTRVTLTASEMAMCKQLGIEPAKYAKEKLRKEQANG